METKLKLYRVVDNRNRGLYNGGLADILVEYTNKPLRGNDRKHPRPSLCFGFAGFDPELHEKVKASTCTDVYYGFSTKKDLKRWLHKDHISTMYDKKLEKF